MNASKPPPAQVARPGEEQSAKVARLIQRLEREGFFGTVVVSFQAGRISTVKEERSLKLEDL